MATTQNGSGGRGGVPRQNHRGRPTDAELDALGKVRPLPDGPADAYGLTLRQRLILETIRDTVDDRGYPPSIREMADAVGLAQAAVIRRGEQYRTTQIDTGLPLAGVWTQASAPRWKAEPQGEGSLSRPAKIHPSGVASPTCSQPRDSPCTRKTSPRGAVRSTRALPSGPARRLAGLRTSTRGRDGATCAAAGGGGPEPAAARARHSVTQRMNVPC